MGFHREASAQRQTSSSRASALDRLTVRPEPPTMSREETRPDVIAQLEALDDVIFAAIDGDPAALQESSEAWQRAVDGAGSRHDRGNPPPISAPCARRLGIAPPPAGAAAAQDLRGDRDHRPVGERRAVTRTASHSLRRRRIDGRCRRLGAGPPRLKHQQVRYGRAALAVFEVAKFPSGVEPKAVRVIGLELDR